MAKLPQNTGGTGLQIAELAPVGQHVAVCLRVNDQFQVERPTFENPQVKELTDVTRFLFGLIGQDGRPYLIQTYEFTISGAPGSNLMKFLKLWLGQEPQIGWDYCEMVGRGAMLTVAHKASRKNAAQMYANINGIAPVHPQLASHVPATTKFDAMIAALERGGSGQRAATPPPQPGPTHPYPAPSAPPAYTPPPAPSFPPPAPVAPPTAPAAFVPPPPPAPVVRNIFVAENGQSRLATPDELRALAAAGKNGLPAIYEGDTNWTTVGELVAGLKADEDVPF